MKKLLILLLFFPLIICAQNSLKSAASVYLSFKQSLPSDSILIVNFDSEEFDNSHIIKKIDDYGLDILNNVIREIKIYINT